MITRHKGNVTWLEFELLAGLPLAHGCFDRHGGVSEPPFATLNTGVTCGDEPSKVFQNRRIILDTLGQTHGVVALCAQGADVISIDAFNQENQPLADGITTQLPNLALIVTQADCQGAIFYDPIKHVLGNIHCGWRGNVCNIYANTVKYMHERFGSKPENLLVCISPSLGPESSEFINWRTELASFAQFQFKSNYFDLWAISQAQLQEAGVLPHHIQIAGIDTYANDNYFSFRRENRRCGRQATVCALLPSS